VGFYLWIADDLAWAQGTYEYRPMGAAVIAASDLFTRRDFDPRRKIKPPSDARYLGQFASLGQLNGVLRLNRNRYRVSAAARRGLPWRA
jgi:hypothetical protein